MLPKTHLFFKIFQFTFQKMKIYEIFHSFAIFKNALTILKKCCQYVMSRKIFNFMEHFLKKFKKIANNQPLVDHLIKNVAKILAFNKCIGIGCFRQYFLLNLSHTIFANIYSLYTNVSLFIKNKKLIQKVNNLVSKKYTVLILKLIKKFIKHSSP